MEKPDTYTGTSGWHYKHWNGTFYPPEMLEENCLDFYCKGFQTVEINNTFFSYPKWTRLKNGASECRKALLFQSKLAAGSGY